MAFPSLLNCGKLFLGESEGTDSVWFVLGSGNFRFHPYLCWQRDFAFRFGAFTDFICFSPPFRKRTAFLSEAAAVTRSSLFTLSSCHQSSTVIVDRGEHYLKKGVFFPPRVLSSVYLRLKKPSNCDSSRISVIRAQQLNKVLFVSILKFSFRSLEHSRLS